MTFKQLTQELIREGWRAYYIPDIPSFIRGHHLNTLAIRNLLEVMVYEGKNVVFVKTIHPPLGEEVIEND